MLEAKVEIERIWREETTTTPIFRKIKAITHFYKKNYKQKAQQTRVSEATLRTQLEQVTWALDDRPDCPDLQ
jgi:hypothetical protein